VRQKGGWAELPSRATLENVKLEAPAEIAGAMRRYFDPDQDFE
jgi:hypothetical protein